MNAFTARQLIATGLSTAVLSLLLGGCPRVLAPDPSESIKTITAFSISDPPALGTIDEATRTIAVTVPHGTDVTALVATFTTTGTSVMVDFIVQVSGLSANDFTNPVSYVVTAIDGSTASYTVTVSVALSSAKAITAFSFASPAATAVIDEAAKTIEVTVPKDTDVTALVAAFTTTGSKVTIGSELQVSGSTANNFTSPVVYTVTAEDGTSASYLATVIVGSWQTVGTAVLGAGGIGSRSLAIDSTGTLYVACADGWTGGRATVMAFNADSWQAVGKTGFSAGPASPCLAIDPSGTLYVAYKDGANGNRPTVMKYAGGSWQVVGTAGFSEESLDTLPLEVDAAGTPYVAFQDYGNDRKATVMKHADGSWQVVGTAGFSAGAAFYLSMTMDSTGAPYVGYQDGGNGNLATVMKYADGSWQTVGAPGFSSLPPVYTSLAMGPGDSPYIGYSYNGTTVMTYAGGSWQVVGTERFTGGAWNTSLAIDSTGTPYVGYQDRSNGYRATVMKYAGGSWQVVGKVGFSSATNVSVSMAVDPSDTPYLAFATAGYFYGPVTVMAFR